MSIYNFIPDEVYENLPEDPSEQLEILLEKARERYLEVVENQVGDRRDQTTIAYMQQVRVIVKELGFGSIPAASSSPVVPGEWTSFETALSGIKTRIRLRANKSISESSVALGRVTKFRVEQEIDRLREIIDVADIPASKKKALNSKLDELIEELHRQRLSFAKLAAVVAAVAGVLGGTSATLANGPEAVETIGRILHWVGEEKAAEEAEQLRLSSPPKALPPPSQSPAKAADEQE